MSWDEFMPGDRLEREGVVWVVYEVKAAQRQLLLGRGERRRWIEYAAVDSLSPEGYRRLPRRDGALPP